MKKQAQPSRKLQMLSPVNSTSQTNFMLGSGFYRVPDKNGREIVLRRSRRIMQKDPVDYTVFFSRIIRRKPRYQKIQIMKRTTRQRIPIGPQDEDFEGTLHTDDANHFHGPFCQCAGPLQEQAVSSIVPPPRPAQVVNVKDTKKPSRGRPKKRRAPTSAQARKRRRMPKMESPAHRYEGCDPNIMESDVDPSPGAMLPHSSFEIVDSGEDDMNIFVENNNNDTANVPTEKVPFLVRNTTTVQELGPEGEVGLHEMGDHPISPSVGSANSPLPEPDNIAHPSGSVLRLPPSLQPISAHILETMDQPGPSQPNVHLSESQRRRRTWSFINLTDAVRLQNFLDWTIPYLTPGRASSQSTTEPESTEGASTQNQAPAPLERSKKSKKKSRK
ncbi:unnamed protein product [Cylicocyclus nassatus]|uniref:Uncharacterized protein n=1 Tax=Cylicocyclus nassatus TaxID=53992 RepID=A0AA36GXN3_CYLNA|nr:unnamed protein product [Cylicocyclus nassatus]